MSGSKQSGMNKFNVKDIPPDSYFTKPAYIDGQFIVTVPEAPVTDELKQTLSAWDFKEIMSDGENLTEYAAQNAAGNDEAEPAVNSSLSDGDHLQQAQAFYRNFQQYVELLFTQITVTGKVGFTDAAEKVKEACAIIREERRYLLRVIENPERSRHTSGDNYLAAHTVTSIIISVIIGIYLKMPSHRLIELGIAALFHEVGMLKLPPKLYLNKRSLSSQERKAILTHTILGYTMLKSFGFPLVISLAALEHHERENGEGYPQKITGEKISLYAKIIAVACSYEALTHARPHKDGKDSYAGMLDLLKNVGKYYDDTVLRALVYSLSIYPIGLYVLLSNGRKGQVVEANPGNPRCPIVQILDGISPGGKSRTVETSPNGLTVLRPLLTEEIDGIPKPL
jgi:HD-GYP domain-containing protein (c-di-GMP phosphodiesterase class II)